MRGATGRIAFVVILLVSPVDMCLRVGADSTLVSGSSSVTTSTVTTTTTTALCSPSNTFECPTGWTLFVDPGTFCGYCYNVIGGSYTFAQAIDACPAFASGAYLASILTAAENDFLLPYLQGVLGMVAIVWIGLMSEDSMVEDTAGWEWVNGDPYSYTGGWETFNPKLTGESCAAYDAWSVGLPPISFTGWYDYSCVGTVWPALCKMQATIVPP